MNIFRTDSQVALNTLLVAAMETLDHYRDAVEMVETNFGHIFGDIGKLRRELIHRLKDAVRASGDLPAVPDPDKEAGEMLLHRIAAMIKSSYAVDILEQRIEGEKKLADLIVEAQTTDAGAQYAILLDEFARHVSETISQLQALHSKFVDQNE